MSTTGSENSPLLADPGGDADTDEAEELCAQVVRSGRLHMITQISSGVPDFAVDTLPERPTAADAADVAMQRANCRSAARLFATFVDTQDAQLEDVRTGRLIRVVLHAGGGAVFCYPVVPGQSVVGFVYDRGGPRPELPLARQPLVNRADHAMTELAEQLRNLLGLPPQNAGGWSSEGREGPIGSAEADLLTTAVDPADLHYVARVRSGQDLEAVDNFEHPSLRQHFRLIAPAARRKFYEALSGELCQSVAQVGRLIRATVGGSVLRLVLDVEQGAVIYYRLGVGDYLVGVTLNQGQVGAADGKLATLATVLGQRES